MRDGDVSGFFEFLRLAKEEYRVMLEEYPELSLLSPRETEVFSLLLTDKTLSEIADDMFISYSSVHFHCKNIYKKLNISGRKQIYTKYKELM